MENGITELLGLHGYMIVGLGRSADGDELSVQLPARGECPECRQPTSRVHQYSKQLSRILWNFVGQRPVWIVLRRRRLWCEECQRAFTQALPGVAKKQRVSILAQVQLLQNLAEQSFASLKRAQGMSYGRVQRVLLRLRTPWCDWDELAQLPQSACETSFFASFLGLGWRDKADCY